MLATYLEYRTTMNMTEIRDHPINENTYGQLHNIFKDSELYISKEHGYIGYEQINSNGTAQNAPNNVVFNVPSKVKQQLENYYTNIRTLIFDGSQYDANETAAISKLIDRTDFKLLTSFGWKNVNHQMVERWTQPKDTVLFATFYDGDGSAFPMDLNSTLPNVYQLNLYLRRDHAALQSMLRFFRNMLNFGFFVTAQMLSFAAGAFAVFFWLNPQVQTLRTNLAFHRDFIAYKIPVPELRNVHDLTLKEYNDDRAYGYDQYIRFDQIKRFEIEINFKQQLTSAMRLPYIFDNLEEFVVTFHPEYSKKYVTDIPAEWISPLLFKSTALKHVALPNSCLNSAMVNVILSSPSIRQISAAYPKLEHTKDVFILMAQSNTLNQIIFYNVDLIDEVAEYFRKDTWKITYERGILQIDRIKSMAENE